MKNLLIVTFLGICLQATAQKTVVISVRDSVSDLAVRDAVITARSGKGVSPTDYKGITSFAMDGREIFTVKAPNYIDLVIQADQPTNDSIILYMQPGVRILENVTIASMYSKYQLDSISRRTDFEQDEGPKVTTVDKNRTEGFGLVVNLDKPFKKKYRNQKKAENWFNQQEKQYYISARYPPSMVSYYTGLKADALLRFMDDHTPSYKWLRAHTDRLELIDYISAELKKTKS